jgi:hypothetical protein
LINQYRGGVTAARRLPSPTPGRSPLMTRNLNDWWRRAELSAALGAQSSALFQSRAWVMNQLMLMK